MSASLAESSRRVGGALVVAAVVLVAVGAVVATSLPSGPAGPLDATWYRWMVDAETRWLVTVAEWLDLIGGAVVMVPLIATVGVVLAWRQRWSALMVWVIAAVGAELASTGLKVLYGRERPPAALEVEASMSFPSGHAKTAAMVSLGLVLLFAGHGSRGRWLLAAAGYAAVMAWSRTYLRVHWLTDVVGGLAVGVVVTLLVVLAVQAVAARRRTEADRG